MVWSKLFGLYLIVDGIGSVLIYQKQKIKFQGRIYYIKQTVMEHMPRLFRAFVGVALVTIPIPF